MNFFAERKYKVAILVVFITLLIISCINPVYPSEMFLQHSITILMIVFLIIITVKKSLSDRSFSFLVFFMILHIVGARWIYSYVPYDDWFKSITGLTITGIFGSARNNYDRFVHLMFGLMLIPPLKEIYVKWFNCPPKLSGLMAFLTILGLSLAYEVFEWGLTLVLSPQDAEDYNGQQGDIWDAQKDMALAMLGAGISLFICSLTKNKEHEKKSAD